MVDVVQSVATKHKNSWNVCDMCAENFCLYSSSVYTTSSTYMTSFVELLNTKVVDNLRIFAVLKFHDFRSLGLGVTIF